MKHTGKISLSIFSHSHLGHELTVHCHSGVFVENAQGGDSGTFAAHPGVHHHAEAPLLGLVTQGCQLKRCFSG